jgi:hypothetical protein
MKTFCKIYTDSEVLPDENNNCSLCGGNCTSDIDNQINTTTTMKKVIEALNQFAQAQQTITQYWDNFDGKDHSVDDCLNIQSYPFESSFDEYNIRDWVKEMTNKLTIWRDMQTFREMNPDYTIQFDHSFDGKDLYPDCKLVLKITNETFKHLFIGYTQANKYHLIVDNRDWLKAYPWLLPFVNEMPKDEVKTTPKEALHTILAKQFSAKLLEWIGSINMREVIKRNEDDRNKAICHSHDFCDTNQAMIDVLEENHIVDLDFDTVNIVWNIARANKFFYKN